MMSEHAPGGLVDNGRVKTIDQYGEVIEVPVTELSQLENVEYSWGDAMVVTFDEETGGTDE